MKWPSPCFAIENPKINYIKNQNTCYTTTYHMQQLCGVSNILKKTVRE